MRLQGLTYIFHLVVNIDVQIHSGDHGVGYVQ
jgi:hypothetical protein